MKTLIILTDGMADLPVKEWGNLTPLAAADTPFLDKMAREGKNGLIETVPSGEYPCSETANFSILGYEMRGKSVGRAALEALGAGVELSPNDLVLRVNFVCQQKGTMINHAPLPIGEDEAAVLMNCIAPALPAGAAIIPRSLYKQLIILREESGEIATTPPQDIIGKKIAEFFPKSEKRELQEHLQKMINSSMKIFEQHPVNFIRQKQGLPPITAIWLWGAGRPFRPMPIQERHPQINRATMIAGSDLMKGIAKCCRMECPDIEGATGQTDTNFANKAEAAIKALRTNELVYLHIEATDEAGHQGDACLKKRCIEEIDRKIVGPIFRHLQQTEEAVAVAILPDHPTPCEIRRHTSDKVPYIIWYKGITPDKVESFSETSAAEGELKGWKAPELADRLLNLPEQADFRNSSLPGNR